MADPVGIWTDQGKYRLMSGYFPDLTIPASFRVLLATKNVMVTEDTIKDSELELVDLGSDSTLPLKLFRNLTDFPTVILDSPNHRARVTLRDVEWIAGLLGIPASGDGIRQVVLTDGDFDVGLCDVFAAWDLKVDYTRDAGESFIASGLKLGGKRPAP